MTVAAVVPARQSDGPWPARNRESSRGPAGDEKIRRLDVAVDDPGGMRRLERVGDLDGERQQQIDLERAPGNAMLQRRPVEKLHHEERPAVLLADIVDGADVGVIQRRGGARLAAESGQGSGSSASSGDRNFNATKRSSRVSSAL